jgi:hypothetical protein
VVSLLENRKNYLDFYLGFEWLEYVSSGQNKILTKTHESERCKALALMINVFVHLIITGEQRREDALYSNVTAN